MIPIARAIYTATHKTVVGIMGSQMSKTETMANIMGCRLDDEPVPLLYVAPTKSFVENVFEPRFTAMVENCKTLLAKRIGGKQEKKTLKKIAGVKVRFAWAGSATELAGDPACKVFVDERDRMEDNVGSEGDPKELADARHTTYADGQTIVFSTPTNGTVETEVRDGFEFWKEVPGEEVGETIGSATWKLYQEGTMRHWAVPCPHCQEYFIPRFTQLTWPHGEGGSSLPPAEAAKKAQLICFRCGALIDEEEKETMHQAGLYIAPGQKVSKAGNVIGPLPERSSDSFWCSGLMSPWQSWGEITERWLKAVRSGDPERIQTVINTKFGELYSVAGEAPATEAVLGLRMPYPLGQLPNGVIKIFMGIDVQKNRLVYTIRGFGLEMESWHLGAGELMGNTDEPDVWHDLQMFKDQYFGGIAIEKCFIDSGYRPQFVYQFCRNNRTWAFPTKGRDTLQNAPLTYSKLDSTNSGKRFGLGLWMLNTDYFKRWIHERIERDPMLPGGFHLAEDTTDDYCLQLVAEARVQKPSGKVTWVQIRKDNHFLDAEMNCLAAAYSSNMQAYTREWYEKEQARHGKPGAKKAKAAIKRKAGAGGAGFRQNETQSKNKAGKFAGGWFNR